MVVWYYFGAVKTLNCISKSYVWNNRNRTTETHDVTRPSRLSTDCDLPCSASRHLGFTFLGGVWSIWYTTPAQPIGCISRYQIYSSPKHTYRKGLESYMCSIPSPQMSPPAVPDERVPLLPAQIEKKVTPLPKLQMTILFFLQLAEPISSHVCDSIEAMGRC